MKRVRHHEDGATTQPWSSVDRALIALNSGEGDGAPIWKPNRVDVGGSVVGQTQRFAPAHIDEPDVRADTLLQRKRDIVAVR